MELFPRYIKTADENQLDGIFFKMHDIYPKTHLSFLGFKVSAMNPHMVVLYGLVLMDDCTDWFRLGLASIRHDKNDGHLYIKYCGEEFRFDKLEK